MHFHKAFLPREQPLQEVTHLLQEVGNALAFWQLEAQALKEGQDLIRGPMEHDMACIRIDKASESVDASFSSPKL
jgi:hypothetical protein